MISISNGLHIRLQIMGYDNYAIQDLMAGGVLRIYAGVVPESADAALGESSVLLAELRPEASREFAKSALHTGSAAFYRWEHSDDAGDETMNALRVQGSMGEDMNRESRIADLVIHGWEPVKTNFAIGIKNADMQYAVGVVQAPHIANGPGNASHMYHSHKGKVIRLFFSGNATWDDVTDEILDKIEERLNAT